jgi:hypothetical protein
VYNDGFAGDAVVDSNEYIWLSEIEGVPVVFVVFSDPPLRYNIFKCRGGELMSGGEFVAPK